jgi:ABC-type transport system involved in cytochrome c biogenesis permease subunit
MESHHQHPVSETGVLLIELQGMAFVAGLAPAKHGLERPVARPLGAHEQLMLIEMVLPRGNAPRSSAYQAGALLLSYRRNIKIKMVEGVGNAPTSARADPVFETGAASLYLPAFQKGSTGINALALVFTRASERARPSLQRCRVESACHLRSFLLRAVATRTMYRKLDAQKIVDTARALQLRIAERFPDSGLSKLGAEVATVGDETMKRMQWIQRPHVPLRIAIHLLLVTILVVFVALLASLRKSELNEIGAFIQALEAGLSSLFFIGAATIFLISWESRIKRNRALKALRDLRAMAHIVDMHQLTKNPEGPSVGGATVLLAKRALSASELGRYLNYCSELLSLIGKISALYSQSLDDPVVLNAVDDIEDLTTELSQRIWQKITLLDIMKSADTARRTAAT